MPNRGAGRCHLPALQVRFQFSDIPPVVTDNGRVITRVVILSSVISPSRTCQRGRSNPVTAHVITHVIAVRIRSGVITPEPFLRQCDLCPGTSDATSFHHTSFLPQPLILKTNYGQPLRIQPCHPPPTSSPSSAQAHCRYRLWLGVEHACEQSPRCCDCSLC